MTAPGYEEQYPAYSRGYIPVYLSICVCSCAFSVHAFSMLRFFFYRLKKNVDVRKIKSYPLGQIVNDLCLPSSTKRVCPGYWG